MNTANLKSFAPEVRRQLMEAVTRKLDFTLTTQTPDLLTTFASQVATLRKLAQTDRAGLIERVAYTWFNRLAALRFMDARGWHPFRARVLTPAGAAETQPELLKITRTGTLPEELKPHTNPTRLNDLLDGHIPSPDAQGEVYRHLVLAACRFYNALLPDLFEKLDDETELLLPDDLLTEHSVVHGFRTAISDEDCGDGQRANVEILGWLYQFYISERKDQVMARKSAVPTEDIPAVTQLFTPHWIVRYLVENSLGRLWLLNRPGSRLREHMPYYIEGEKNAPGDSPDDFLKIAKPEEIRLLDPAVGSGHMLTYAFDLLTLIYEEEGYAPTEIPALILRHNLHGLEICPRAAQLAELALVFKAREKSRRFFQPEHLVRPHIIELRDVRFDDNELSAYFKALGTQPSRLHPELAKLLHQFEEAKNFGALIQPCLDESAIAKTRRAITDHWSLITDHSPSGQLFLRETHLKVLRVLEQAGALTQRYHVVVANPPYMGGRQMNGFLKQFASDNYTDSKSDLFAMFMERGFSLTVLNGWSAMVTMQSWMFLRSYEALRQKTLQERTIHTMVHMANMVMGIAFGTVATVWGNSFRPSRKGEFSFVAYEDTATNGKPTTFPIKNRRLTRACASDFNKIPGSPIAYWCSPQVIAAFSGRTIGSVLGPKKGLLSSDDERFFRYWHEVGHAQFGATARCGLDTIRLGLKWVPLNKGGQFRKWYGNHDLVMNWENDGKEMKEWERHIQETRNAGGRVINEDFYFRSGVTWADVTSGETSFRLMPRGMIFNARGPCVFGNSEAENLLVLGYLNSKVAMELAGVINPTICLNPSDLGKLPYPPEVAPAGKMIVAELLDISRKDWDNFETSWDFRDQPLLRPGLKGATLEASWQNWDAQSAASIRRMQELETENNRLFIAAYGLAGELQPEVPEAQITLARAEARRDMAAFLSYAVGCMMGRFSLEAPGLILANAGDTLEDYIRIVAKKTKQTSPSPLTTVHCPLTTEFHPDPDGILPVLDGEWFEDDIVARTRDFLRATFGETTLRENLRFIEESLGKDLRKYFLTDFYKDHLQTYKKRPIYWLVQSPRKGFNVLLYLHRYTRDTMNLVLNRYLREYQVKLRNRLAHLTQEQATASTAKAKTEARKETDRLTKILHECDEWERQTVLPLAQTRIDLDLDDGVKVNYLKLGEALAPIAGLAAKEDE